MTLEEMQDLKAYPLTMPRKTYSPDEYIDLMRADAKKISKPGLPRVDDRRGLADVEDARRDRMLTALKGGAKTRKQLSQEIGVHYRTIVDYVRPLLTSGEVVRIGWDGRTEKFGLASEYAK